MKKRVEGEDYDSPYAGVEKGARAEISFLYAPFNSIINFSDLPHLLKRSESVKCKAAQYEVVAAPRQVLSNAPQGHLLRSTAINVFWTFQESSMLPG